MSASTDGARAGGAGAPAIGPASPKRALAGRVARVFGADLGLGRAIAVELAGRGAEVWVVGADERRLGEAVGEIAYQGGWGRHIVLPTSSWSGGEAASLPEPLAGPADLVVAAIEAPGPSVSAASCAALLERLSPLVSPGGALLLATTGAPAADVALWLRTAARAAGRSGRTLSLNLVALASVEGDADGAARIAALLCSTDAAGLTGQLVVVASA